MGEERQLIALAIVWGSGEEEDLVPSQEHGDSKGIHEMRQAGDEESHGLVLHIWDGATRSVEQAPTRDG